jgi:hypothetical protein
VGIVGIVRISGNFLVLYLLFNFFDTFLWEAKGAFNQFIGIFFWGFIKIWKSFKVITVFFRRFLKFLTYL